MSDKNTKVQQMFNAAMQEFLTHPGEQYVISDSSVDGYKAFNDAGNRLRDRLCDITRGNIFSAGDPESGTNLKQVFAMIKEEAAEYGCKVEEKFGQLRIQAPDQLPNKAENLLDTSNLKMN